MSRKGRFQKEFVMFRSDLSSYPYIGHGPSYTANLAKAGRGFLAALLAMDPEELQSKSAANNPAFDEAMSIDELAQHFDAIMPNQAAELRYLAGGGPDDGETAV